MLQNSGNPTNRGIELAYGLLRVFLVALIAFPASAQERKNETGFLLGSEQIPGFTTTAGTPLSLGGSVAFSFDYARRLKGERTGLFVEVPFCGQSCVTTTPSTRQITAHPFASRDSTI